MANSGSGSGSVVSVPSIAPTLEYTYDLSTDVGKVRLSIGDNDIASVGAGIKPDGTNFTDQELQFIIEQAGSWRAAVPFALRTLANLYASQANRVGLEQYSEDYGKVVDNLLKAATEWEAKSGTEESPLYSTVSSNVDAPHLFGTRMWGAKVTDWTED